MKIDVKKIILECLNEKDEDKETLEEEGAMAAPATDTSATNGSLPVPPLGKVAKRKSLEDLEELI